jgi:uncharacterized delta-60 repeat protein
MRTRIIALLITATLLLTACYEARDEFTINPDGSGKVAFVRIITLMGDPDETLTMTVANMVKKWKGVEAWKDITFELQDDGRGRIAGTAYFPDIRTFGNTEEIDTLEGVSLTRSGDQLRLELSGPEASPEKAETTSGTAKTAPLTEEEVKQAIKKKRAEYQAQKTMMAMMLKDLKIERRFRLPGKIATVNALQKESDSVAIYSLDGLKLLQAMDEAMKDDSFVGLTVRVGTGKESEVSVPPKLRERMSGEAGPAAIEVAGELKNLFDYAAEVRAAKTTQETLLAINKTVAVPVEVRVEPAASSGVGQRSVAGKVDIAVKAKEGTGAGTVGGKSYANPIEVELTFTGGAAASAYRFGKTSLTMALGEEGKPLLPISLTDDFARINHSAQDIFTKQPVHPADGFRTKLTFFRPEVGIARLTRLSGSVTVQTPRTLTIDSIGTLLAGRKKVQVSHPALDALGTFSLSREGEWLSVVAEGTKHSLEGLTSSLRDAAGKPADSSATSSFGSGDRITRQDSFPVDTDDLANFSLEILVPRETIPLTFDLNDTPLELPPVARPANYQESPAPLKQPPATPTAPVPPQPTLPPPAPPAAPQPIEASPRRLDSPLGWSDLTPSGKVSAEGQIVRIAQPRNLGPGNSPGFNGGEYRGALTGDLEIAAEIDLRESSFLAGDTVSPDESRFILYLEVGQRSGVSIGYVPNLRASGGAAVVVSTSGRTLPVPPGNDTIELVLRRVGDVVGAFARIGAGEQVAMGSVDVGHSSGSAGAPLTRVRCGVMLGRTQAVGQDVYVVRSFQARPLQGATLPPSPAPWEEKIRSEAPLGNGVMVRWDSGQAQEAGTSLARSPDGKVIAAGTRRLSNPRGVTEVVQVLVARFMADGSLDPAFGSGGFFSWEATGFYAGNVAAALSPDGKILVAGSLRFAASKEEKSEIVVLRLGADGKLDPGFGAGGVVRWVGDRAVNTCCGLAVQADGKALVAGGAKSMFQGRVEMAPVLLRLDANGILDPTFRSGLAARDKARVLEKFSDLAIQPDGKILCAGTYYTANPSHLDAILTRFNADGSLDTGFGQGGSATWDNGGAGETVSALAIQPDGGSLIAGSSGRQRDNRVFLLRFGADGSPDAGFGRGGVVFWQSGRASDHARSLGLLPDGKFVVAGTSYDSAGGGAGMSLIRFNPDGSLDTGFGAGGVVTWLGGASVQGDQVLYDLLLEPDGTALLTGSIGSGMNVTDLFLMKVR